MRLAIRHETAYAYCTPARRAIELLRLTPRGHNGEFVVAWRIDVDKDCRLVRSIDAFGNSCHAFTVEGPVDRLTIVASGSIETQDTNGVLAGQIELLPPQVFLRETSLSAPDAAIGDFARFVQAHAGSNPLNVLHALMAGIHDRMIYQPDKTGPGTGAAEAFAISYGVCQDFAHIFIAAARCLDIPARYVSGYLYQPDGQNPQSAGHAWAEALVPDVGWVGFDPTNNVSPTDLYVRVAVGLDYLGAAPIRGAVNGGGNETMTVNVEVADAAARQSTQRQAQQQAQSRS